MTTYRMCVKYDDERALTRDPETYWMSPVEVLDTLEAIITHAERPGSSTARLVSVDLMRFSDDVAAYWRERISKQTGY